MTEAYQDAVALRDQGRYAEAEARLRAGAPAQAREVQLLLQNLLMLQARPPPPRDAAMAVAMARALAELRGPPVLQGADEGPRLQRAVELVRAALPDLADADRVTAAYILWRGADYEAAQALGDLATLGRQAARAGAGRSLLHQLARVETDEDRFELLAQHRLWAAALERVASERPVVRPPRAGGERLRLGFLSSDLRVHVVAYFVQPLFQFIDPRFELFVYSSFPGPPDVMQPWFAGRASAYRLLPQDDREAAEVIAADGLDILVELGGPTAHSRPGVMAFKPAPLQASWLGYPHSLGLSAIDRYVCDPHLAPPRPELLLEQPLVMPSCWIAMSPAAFQATPPLTPDPPARRKGYVTFGTANDPYKYSPRVIRAWAQVLARVPGARFMIVRPEAGAACFQENLGRLFASEGVSADRLEFRAVRGGVRPQYAEMDIALDTFPLTGGTTTCEALWMGVPTVTLVGDAPYERLSWSILANADLAELGAGSLEAYVATAAALAADVEKLAGWRAGMRDRITGHPIGRPAQFAADFYDLLAEAVAGRR